MFFGAHSRGAHDGISCGYNSPTAELSKEAKQCHLGLLIVSVLFHIGIIGAGVFGSINPVTAVALHGLVRLGLVYNLKVLDGSLCVA